ncbi:hypothetical protein SLE2022_061450 [Rubroshorea leprosula]
MSSFLSKLPSMSTLLSAYASLSTAIMLIRSILSEIVPKPIQELISSKLYETLPHYFFPNFIFIVPEQWQSVNNERFRSVEAYLPTRISPSATSLEIGSNPFDPHKLELRIPVDCKIIDEFRGTKLEWSLLIKDEKSFHSEKRYFRLKCKRSDREEVMARYFPHIDTTAQTILNQREKLHIYTYNKENGRWKSAVFKHPARFDTLAMEPKLKEDVINDLDAFCGQKEFFQKVGRAWKRGYLLHGPPGTGKSSLVAAIANHLRCNIYDLQLQRVRSDAELRRILTFTTSRSILLVEDIDCSTKASRDRSTIKDEQGEHGEEKLSSSNPGVTLSGLLNFIDGLWSSCGDERVIIFTTNHKDKLDPALLRPGRMDFEAYMGYCAPAAFRQLADTYLQIEDHHLFTVIEDLLKHVKVTPVEVG